MLTKATPLSTQLTLQEYLAQWKIKTDLLAAFAELGVEEPDDMSEIEPSEITSNGLKKVEARKLRKCYQAITNTDTSTANGSSGETKETVTATQHAEAKLPPELENFDIIKEMKSVAAVLNDPTFVAAQVAVQNNSSDAAAVTQLREAVAKATTAINAAVELRIQEKGIQKTCGSVILAGNEDFEKVYEAMWGMTHKSDAEGCAEYTKKIRELTTPDKSTNQTTSDPAELFQHAALTHANYQAIVRTIGEKVNGVKLSLPDDLKKMGRIIEKTILKRPDDVGNANKVCDIVRGMVTCDNMTQIANVVGHIGASDDIVVTRVKDRFFEAPSAGGWRDCMINFYVKADSNQHICEIQLVHDQMMTARKGLPGHAVYNRVRNASELLFFMERLAREKAAREKAAAPEELQNVQPGLNSLKNALKKAKKYGIKEIKLLNGEHTIETEKVQGYGDDPMNILIIDFPVTIIGESKDGCTIIIGGLMMNGKKEDDVNVKHLTISQSMRSGVSGRGGMSFPFVSFEYREEWMEWCICERY